MHVNIQRICVATDFSPTAEHAVHYAAGLADKYGAELHLLHVLQDPEVLVSHPDLTQQNERVKSYLSQLEQQSSHTGLEQGFVVTEVEETPEAIKAMYDTVQKQFDDQPRDEWWERLKIYRAVRYGKPVSEIGRYVHVNQIDLLVMGTQGRTGLKRLLMGSVAERVVRACPCPVLTVHEPGERQFVFED